MSHAAPPRIKSIHAIHPGEILLKDFLEPLELSRYRLAKDIHVTLPRINDIVNGKRPISADTALRLGKYFGLPAQFWMNLQADYDLRLARANKDLKKIKPRAAAWAETKVPSPSTKHQALLLFEIA
jgi:addiction module HigA family antidote